MPGQAYVEDDVRTERGVIIHEFGELHRPLLLREGHGRTEGVFTASWTILRRR